MVEIIRLCISGYSVVPSEIFQLLKTARLQPSGIDQLSLKECALLKELGQGADDEFIARRLSMSECGVKMMIRAVLAKMHFETRDEARRFSNIHRASLQNARRSKIQIQSRREGPELQDPSVILRIAQQLAEGHHECR